MHNISNLYKYSFLVALTAWILNFVAYFFIGNKIFVPDAGSSFFSDDRFLVTLTMGILTFYFTHRLRNENGGYFTYKESFKTIFTFGIIYGIGEVILFFVLYNFIAPELFEKIVQMFIWQFEDGLKISQNAEQAKILESYIEVLKQYEITIKKTDSFHFEILGVHSLWVVIKYAFYALILGFAFKKQNPNPFD